MSVVVPDLYDSWGSLARAQGMTVIPEGLVTDDGNGHVVFGSTLLLMANGGANDWIRVAAGSFTLSSYDALCVDIPPTSANQATIAAYVDPYLGSVGGEKYPKRDRIVLGVRNANGYMSWRFPALQSAARDIWHTFDAASEPPFLNSWQDYGAYGPAGFTKLPSGLVVMRGLVKNPTTVDYTRPFATLPVSCRPESTVLIPTMGATSAYNLMRIDIYPSGDCQLNSVVGWVAGETIATAGTAIAWVTLHPVRFMAAA